jgi:epoxyqueuosine reductase
VLERAWAVRAGLGFVGKNGMLIVPGLGSLVLLGEVVTTLDLSPAGGTLDPLDARTTARCGSCTRCLDACPTAAFPAPYVLDARRCVSYLTIEHPGVIAQEARPGIGGHLFGCDDCQTVCPFNAGQRVGAPSDRPDPFAPLERWATVAVDSLLALDEAAWRERIAGTPLQRAGRVGLARNAAIVLGNGGDHRALPALRDAAAHHDDAVVREAAAWAIEQIERRSST